jgi:transposase
LLAIRLMHDDIIAVLLAAIFYLYQNASLLRKLMVRFCHYLIFELKEGSDICGKRRGELYKGVGSRPNLRISPRLLHSCQGPVRILSPRRLIKGLRLGSFFITLKNKVMQIAQIIGADLSKKTIDFYSNEFSQELQIQNCSLGFKQFVKWLKNTGVKLTEVCVVMEHTGLYSFNFEAFLHKHEINFTKVPALAIKRSLGLIRGKTDKLDAKRIARYGFEKKDKLLAQQKPTEVLQRLQMLYSTRDSFVKHRASLMNSVKEFTGVVKNTDSIIKSRLKIINDLSQEIKKVELEIDQLLQSEEALQRNAKLLQSIKGVGKIVAVATIIKTKNFTSFQDSRKFSCYCGTAPFPHTSGTSIQRRTRVSHLADKTMKTLLDLAAKSAVRSDPEIREFYARRLAIGKTKRSTLNIVRNKIIGRMFAVIKRQTPFIENFLTAAQNKFGNNLTLEYAKTQRRE